MRKIQLTIAINFISFVDNDKERVMYSKIDNIKIMMNDDADEVIKEFLIHLKTDVKIKGSEFVFDFGHLLYYKCQ